MPVASQETVAWTMFILGENEPQVVPPIPEPLEPVVDDPEEEDDEEEEEPDEAPVGA